MMHQGPSCTLIQNCTFMSAQACSAVDLACLACSTRAEAGFASRGKRRKIVGSGILCRLAGSFSPCSRFLVATFSMLAPPAAEARKEGLEGTQLRLRAVDRPRSKVRSARRRGLRGELLGPASDVPEQLLEGQLGELIELAKSGARGRQTGSTETGSSQSLRLVLPTPMRRSLKTKREQFKRASETQSRTVTSGSCTAS